MRWKSNCLFACRIDHAASNARNHGNIIAYHDERSARFSIERLLNLDENFSSGSVGRLGILTESSYGRRCLSMNSGGLAGLRSARGPETRELGRSEGGRF